MKINGTPPIHINQSISKMDNMQTMEWTEKTPSSHEHAFAHFLIDTNDQLLAADNALQTLASGQSNSLHQTMLTLEEAKLSFQFMEQVRNRLMSAWQDILREQI